MKKNITFAGFIAMFYSVFSAVGGLVQGVSAASSPLLTSSTTLQDLIKSIMGILSSLVPLLIGAAVVVFLYGVFLFIAKMSSGNVEGRKEGVNFMIWGIVGIAVMVSVWGLVMFVTNTLGTTTMVPQFNTTGESVGNTTIPSAEQNSGIVPASESNSGTVPTDESNSGTVPPPTPAEEFPSQVTN